MSREHTRRYGAVIFRVCIAFVFQVTMSNGPTIRRRKITDYTPDPRNANKGTERGQHMIDTSVESVGLARSIVAASDDTIPAGNKTLQAAMDAGIEDVIEVETDGRALVVVKRKDWATVDSDKAREYAYLDNRASEVGLQWDAEQVLRDLDAGVDLSGMFLDDELDALLAGMDGYGPQAGDDPGAQIDRAEELREKWQTERGQVWDVPSVTVPGRSHRVMCGDSTDVADVARLMDGERAQAIVTDPPYGVDYEGGRNPISNTPREKLDGDQSANLYLPFLQAWKDAVTNKAVFYLWFADREGFSVYSAVHHSGLKVRALIIWNKLNAHYGNFMAQYMQKHEPCLYCVQDSTDWYGPTNEVSVWDIKQPSVNANHPTEKPIECMARPIGNSTKRGDIVADGFLGSGTTAVAAEQTGRICYGMELEPKYVAVTLERLAGMGLEPSLIN